jgi:hypothetical protein
VALSEPLLTYPPLNMLKQVADDIWIVDGPVIGFGVLGLKMPFSTRATVVRLDLGQLFIHSPTALSPELKRQIVAIGTPRWIIAPNRLHYWFVPDWHDAFPMADVYLAPRVREQAGSRIKFGGLSLDRESGYPWDAQIDTLLVAGRYMTEAVFFHRTSRTLVLTDLIENFEPRKLHSWLMRLLTWIGGVQDPHGSMPRDMRLSFARTKPELIAAVRRMIAFNPERIVIAHGRWYDRDGRAELVRAFRWLLG